MKIAILVALLVCSRSLLVFTIPTNSISIIHPFLFFSFQNQAVAASANLFSELEYQTHFTRFMGKFNKKYTNENMFYRYTVFKVPSFFHFACFD
jgi:hypothetical protein